MAISDAAAGTFWYPFGRSKIGTWKALASDDLTIVYEGYPTLEAMTSSADNELDMPEEWVQALIDFCAWRIFERVEKDDRKRAAHHKGQFLYFLHRAKARDDISDGHRAFPRLQDF